MSNRRIHVITMMAALIISFALLSSCNKKSSTNPDGKGDHASWFPPSVNLDYQYRILEGAGKSWDGTAKVLGTDSQTYPGNTYVKVQVGNFTGNVKKGIIMWLDLSKLDKIGYKAAEIYNGNTAVMKKSDRTDWDMLEVYDTPLWVEYTGKLGEQKVSSASAHYYFGNMNNSQSLTMSIAYKYSSLNATVTVPQGKIKNCILMDAVYTQIQGTDTTKFTGTYYMRPDLGIVKAVTIPGYMGAELISGNALKAIMSLAF